MPVGFHVIVVDVGDNGDHRIQIQERGIGLVGLDHDVIATAQPRTGAGGIQAAADHEGRIEAAGSEHARHQARRRRLAVRARDRNPLL